MADRHDAEDDNFAAGFNQAFLRTGTIPMIGDLQMNGNKVLSVGAGNPLQPGITFFLDPDTGFFQPGAGQLAVSVNGVQKGLWTDSGLDVAGNITVNGIEIGGSGGTIGDNIDIPGYVHAGGEGVFGSSVTSGYLHSTLDAAVDRDLYVTRQITTDKVKGEAIHIGAHDLDFSLYRGGASGVDAVMGFDVNDYMHYVRSADELHIVIGGVVAQAMNTGNVQFSGNITGQGIYGTYLQSSGDFKAAGNILTDQSFYPSATSTGNGYWLGRISGGERVVNWTPNYWLGWMEPTGKLRVVQNNAEVTSWDASGNVFFNKQATFFGDTSFNGLNTYVGTGALPAIRFINNTVGHDYRIWAKDAPGNGLHITNESVGVSYMVFRHLGDILVNAYCYFGQRANFQIGSDHAGLKIYGGGAAILRFDDRVDSSYWQQYAESGIHRFWYSGGGDRLLFDVSKVYPVADRAYTLGWAGLRWDQVYCASSTMNTSDAREKDWRGSLNDAELAASKALCKEIGIYRWLRDLERDGDAAKLQCGILAQKVIEVFQANGLDALTYGFVSHQTWEATTYNDADMVEQTNPAGERYFIMFPDILAFLVAGIDQRLTAFEAL